MKGYRTNHRDFSFSVQFPDSLRHLQESSFVICRAPVESLQARIVRESAGETAQHVLTPLGNTPHFASLQGDRRTYQKYLERHGRTVGYGIEHSVDAFEALLSAPLGYLEPPFTSSYITSSAKSSRRPAANRRLSLTAFTELVCFFRKACSLFRSPSS